MKKNVKRGLSIMIPTIVISLICIVFVNRAPASVAVLVLLIILPMVISIIRNNGVTGKTYLVGLISGVIFAGIFIVLLLLAKAVPILDTVLSWPVEPQ